jgi:Carboxypeptidase regulatory-like domain
VPVTPVMSPAPAPAATTSAPPGPPRDGAPAVIVLDEKAAASQAADLELRPDRRAIAIGTLATGGTKAGLEVLGPGSLAGQVLKSKDGLPVKAELALVSTEARVAARHWTGPDGQFILLDLAAGEYKLVVQSIGYRSETVPIVIRSGATSRTNISLVGLGHVYGAVAARDGGWLPGVLLTLTDKAGSALAHTTTDDAGSYYFPRVPEGRYSLAAPGCEATASVVDISPGSAIAADLVLGPAQGQNGEVVVPLAGGA